MIHSSESAEGPCKGLRVVDAAQLVAAPTAATLLADFGADVVKVERPQGDSLRTLGPHKDGVSLWHKVNARNKRNIVLDLRANDDRQTFLDLVAVADVLCTNFIPGTLERLGLAYEVLEKVNPRLVHLEISGFGQDGPDRLKRGFGRSGEAFGGMTYVTGDPKGTPMSSAIPIADTVSGFLGAFAVMAALRERDASGRGQRIDVALYETIFRMLESLAISYDQLGQVMERMGNQNVYSYPVGMWLTKDGKWASFTVSTEAMVQRFFQVIGHPELSTDARFQDNASRVRNKDQIDPIITKWIGEHSFDEIEAIFDRNGLAICPLMSSADIFEDEHYRARNALVGVKDDRFGEIRMQNVFPRFSRTPGSVRYAGRAPDQDRSSVLNDWLDQRG